MGNREDQKFSCLHILLIVMIMIFLLSLKEKWVITFHLPIKTAYVDWLLLQIMCYALLNT